MWGLFCRAGGCRTQVELRMSTMLPSVKGRSWVFQVTALCVVLGALLGLSLKTQKQVVNEGIPSRPQALKLAYREMQKENLKLRKDVSYYKGQTEELSEQLAAGTSSAEMLVRTLDENRILAGTCAVRGPGVVVTVTDSPQLSPTETNPVTIEDFIVHDTDLRKVVDELFGSGAEALSINGQRWVATSSIRCVGITIMYNAVRLAPPYVISAVGDPDDLSYAINTPGGPADDLILLDMITVKKQANVVVPAYTGSTRFNVAKPVEKAR